MSREGVAASVPIILAVVLAAALVVGEAPAQIPAKPQPAAKPSGLSPGAAAPWGPTVSSLTPTLSWTAVPGIASYNVAVASVPTTGSQKPSYAFQAANVRGTSIGVPAGKLQHNTVYVWWIFYLSQAPEPVQSDRRYFMTPRAPTPPAADAKLTLRLLGPGVGGKPPGALPVLSSPEVNLEWEVDHPELVGHFIATLQQIRRLSKNQYTLLPDGFCPGPEVKLAARPGQKRYSTRLVARETGCKTTTFAWWLYAFDTHGDVIKVLGVAGGWMRDDTRMMFFQVNPAASPVQLRLIAPGSAGAPWPVVRSRDLNLEWEVDHPELVYRFDLQLRQESADQVRSCDVGRGSVHAAPNQKRYAYRMTARDGGCKGDTYSWTMTLYPHGKPGVGVGPMQEGGPMRFQAR